MSPTSSILTHAWIWNAIDALARHKELSPSGLARLAGLDPTAFNPSKRFTPEGRPRWPSTESISKILAATSFTLDEFTALAAETERARQAPMPANVPLIGQITNATVGGWHSYGAPLAEGLDAHAKLVVGGGGPFAIEVADASLEPVYRCGLTLVAASNAVANAGDRVLIKPQGGLAVPRLLVGKTTRRVELVSIRGDGEPVELDRSRVDWIARIIWSSGG
ncbi:MAG: helix-turn-helix transcriptional regulator [Hyphomicrobium sp.]|nr:helix-turn-helix transcriptional regulator [Hyphomicrobium sp.]